MTSTWILAINNIMKDNDGVRWPIVTDLSYNFRKFKWLFMFQ